MTFVRAHYQRQTNDEPVASSVEEGPELDSVSVRSDSNVQEEFQFIDSHHPTIVVAGGSGRSPSLRGCFERVKGSKGRLLVAVGFTICVLLILYLLRARCPRVCLTSDCIQISSSILSSMDQNAEPCDDFYRFACGKWELSNPIPDGKSSWSPFEKLHEANQLVLRNILFEANRTNSGAEAKTRDFFTSCFDEEGIIETRKGAPLLHIINEELGGWILLSPESYNISEFEFQTQLCRLQNKYHFGGFFSWNIVEDENNSSQYVIHLPTQDFYVNDTDGNRRVIKALEIMMTRLFRLLVQEERPDEAITKDTENLIKETVLDITGFEKRIANITISTSQRKQENNLYNRITLAQLNTNYPFMNWSSYLNEAFSQINKSIPESQVIILNAPKFFVALSELVLEHRATEKGRSTLSNYMIWQSIRDMKSTLSKAYRDTDLILQKAMFGKEGHEERWRSCIADTDTVLGYALGSLFVRKVFQGSSKTVAEGMISRIKEAFIDNLQEADWMDKETKARAVDKAHSITDMIGYPDYILNEKELNQKYQGLHMNKSDYFGNTLAHSQFVFTESLQRLFKAVNLTQWSMTPPTVNAYYTPVKNQIAFPSGLLQNPFFSVDYPKSLNFGAMGVVMGHEFSHAFDDEGRKYDKKGNRVDWWEPSTTLNFKSKLTCMTTQYSHYSLHNESVDGNITVGENIADNGGLKASYRAYSKWLREHPPELPLPGIKLSSAQLFFVAFAQVWCSSSTKETDHFQLLEDHHSPGKFRVLGPLSNFKEFARVFNCPANSKMNPNNRCEIW
ncbi:Uncharacterized protein FKW44_020703 [Caligus rogercresseyi]|uniref:Endothelin-converting enzyme 1 n=1 Tax=Caligus rogercresseyi TaxID=217165 RepID=A0A7T8GQB3_CALRO|nr:Uncharacterized protein FKW44_020703 [Caligus rogercresseyi]